MPKSKDTYSIEDGIPIPETRGRKTLGEHDLIKLYIEGRKQGLYKSHADGARKLYKYAAIYSGGDETKIDRLQRKFSKAWKALGQL